MDEYNFFLRGGVVSGTPERAVQCTRQPALIHCKKFLVIFSRLLSRQFNVGFSQLGTRLRSEENRLKKMVRARKKRRAKRAQRSLIFCSVFFFFFFPFHSVFLSFSPLRSLVPGYLFFDLLLESIKERTQYLELCRVTIAMILVQFFTLSPEVILIQSYTKNVFNMQPIQLIMKTVYFVGIGQGRSDG